MARTSTGCSTPSSRTEAVNAAIASSSNRDRGCRRLALIDETGMSRKADGSASALGGMRASRPLPSPPRRATTHLLGQFAVRQRTAGRRVEDEDGLAERRRFREPDRPRNDVAAHLGAEMGPYLLDHLVGELGAGVVHGQDNRGELQAGVQVALDEVDVAN